MEAFNVLDFPDPALRPFVAFPSFSLPAVASLFNLYGCRFGLLLGFFARKFGGSTG